MPPAKQPSTTACAAGRRSAWVPGPRRSGRSAGSGAARLGRAVDIVGIPTSEASAQEADACGIPLTTFDDRPILDVTVDGADEVDPALDLIKGGGGAHLREKLVAQASRRLAIVVDPGKLSPALGTNFAVPVEIVRMAGCQRRGSWSRWATR